MDCMLFPNYFPNTIQEENMKIIKKKAGAILLIECMLTAPFSTGSISGSYSTNTRAEVTFYAKKAGKY